MTDWKALEAGINKRRRMHELEGEDGIDSRDRLEAVAGNSYLAGGQFWQLPNDSWGPEVGPQASREPVTATQAEGEEIARQAAVDEERQAREQDNGSDFGDRVQGIMDWSGSTREQAAVLINGLDNLRGDATDEEIAAGQARFDAEFEEAQARWDAGERTPEDEEVDARYFEASAEGDDEAEVEA